MLSFENQGWWVVDKSGESWFCQFKEQNQGVAGGWAGLEKDGGWLGKDRDTWFCKFKHLHA